MLELPVLTAEDLLPAHVLARPLAMGNKKLGLVIHAFGLPSGTAEICGGSMTEACHKACYMRHIEAIRPPVRKRHQQNYLLSRREDFHELVIAQIVRERAQVVRVHTGGELYSLEYLEKWLRIIRACRKTRFFLYTRSWRRKEFRSALYKMSEQRNARVWFSLDRDTGLPRIWPSRVRLAYLMRRVDDLPPQEADLVFHSHHIKEPMKTVNGVPVCPQENGTEKGYEQTCASCQLCFMGLPEDQHPHRLSLPTTR